MADSDYTVAVVLQASDEGMSSTLKKTSDGVKEAGNSARQAQFDFLTLVVGLETLTSGLNQGVGGLRKFSSALRETGMFTDEQSQAMNKQIATIELFTGPMETLIAVQKLLSVATFATASAKNADAAASGVPRLRLVLELECPGCRIGHGQRTKFKSLVFFADIFDQWRRRKWQLQLDAIGRDGLH